MKLLFLGPATVHLANWINEFVLLGANATLITLHRDRHFECNATVIDLSRNVRGGWRKISYLSQLPEIGRLVREANPDVLVCYYATSYGLLGKLTRFKPRIVVAAGSDIHFRGSKRLLLEPIARYVIKGAAAVVCWSPAMKGRLVALGAEDSRLIVQPRGVPLGRFSPAKGPGPVTTIACVRRFSPIFHHDTLIRACAILKQRGGSFRLVLCGDGPERARVEQLASDCGLEGEVEYAGHVSHREISAVLNRADIYVSLADTDGASASLFEAMAAGCYPIVSNIAANAAWIEDRRNGRLVAVDDHEGLAMAVEEAMRNPKELHRVGQINHAFAESQLDLQKNTAAFYALFERIAPRARGAAGAI